MLQKKYPAELEPLKTLMVVTNCNHCHVVKGPQTWGAWLAPPQLLYV